MIYNTSQNSFKNNEEFSININLGDENTDSNTTKKKSIIV